MVEERWRTLIFSLRFHLKDILSLGQENPRLLIFIARRPTNSLDRFFRVNERAIKGR